MFSFSKKEPESVPQEPEKLPNIIGDDIHILPVDDKGIPIFLPIIVGKICDECTTVGIFRTCGNRKTLDKLGNAALNKIKFVIPEGTYLPDLTSFLKEWLRSLPEPILTPSIVNEYLNEKPESVYEVLRWLDPLNRKCIAYIFHMIKVILDHQEENKMNFENLLICFAVSFTQSNEGLKDEFEFQFFYENAIKKINNNGYDFDIF